MLCKYKSTLNEIKLQLFYIIIQWPNPITNKSHISYTDNSHTLGHVQSACTNLLATR